MEYDYLYRKYIANIGIIFQPVAMNRPFFHTIKTELSKFGCICLIAATFSCGAVKSGESGDNSLILKMDSIHMCDSITDASGISIVVTYDVSFPADFKQSKSETDKLRALLNTAILNNNESDMQKAVKAAVTDKLTSYTTSPADPADESLEDETTPFRRFGIRQSVRPVFHSSDFLCITKTSTTSKDSKPSLQSKAYYTFDLISHKRIMLADIFSDNDIPNVNGLLKKQLLESTKCNNADQLADIGYFNADNLSATENFSLTDNSIVFHYNPLEIACYAVGEVNIALPFDEIRQYVSTESPINRLISK